MSKPGQAKHRGPRFHMIGWCTPASGHAYGMSRLRAVDLPQAPNAPTFDYGDQLCRGRSRSGSGESMRLFGQIGGFSRVPRNQAAGSRPLSFAVSSKLGIVAARLRTAWASRERRSTSRSGGRSDQPKLQRRQIDDIIVLSLTAIACRPCRVGWFADMRVRDFVAGDFCRQSGKRLPDSRNNSIAASLVQKANAVLRII